MAKEPKIVDWKQVEKDYRAGIKSNRQIAEENGITEGAIRKKIKQYEWKKDLTGQIKARALELVRTQEVRNEVRTEIAKSETEIVEENAQLQANVIREHRKDITRYRSLASRLLGEIEHVSDNQDLFEQLGELLIDTTPNENGKVDQHQQKRLEALNRAIDLAGRVDSFKKVTDTLKTLIALEREAFNLNAETEVKESLESFLTSL